MIGKIIVTNLGTYLVFDSLIQGNQTTLTCIEFYQQQKVGQFLESEVLEVIELPSNVKSMFFARIKRAENHYLGEFK